MKILHLVKIVVSPKQMENIMSSEDNTSLDISENGAGQGLLIFVVVLASLADLGRSLESEMKMAD